MGSIYSGMPKEERNRIIESRCGVLGITAEYDADGRALYVPDMEDKILYYDNCENPEVKEMVGNALAEMMGSPDGDDGWTEVL